MGYRTYIGTMPKREYNKIKSLDKTGFIEYYKDKDLNEEDFYVGAYEICEELYEFGKYTDFNPPKKSMKKFFKNKELNDFYLEDHDLYIVTKEFLAYIIETYKSYIQTNYTNMISPFYPDPLRKYHGSEFIESVKKNYGAYKDTYEFDFSKITKDEQTALYNMINYVRSIKIEWAELDCITLDEGVNVTNSWKYEYGIFDLVRIYKTFDWKKNVMVYYGY